MEDFEGKLSPLWQSLSGAHIGDGCGTISEGKALFFSSPGRREARTVPLDTTNTRSGTLGLEKVKVMFVLF